MKPKKSTVKLIGNMRIRKENKEKTLTRAGNALYHNKIRATQTANVYENELSRLDGALYSIPAGLQRNALLMSRGELIKKHAQFKIA
jgi:hypothetical protein